jgi:hypothetical protein
MIHSTPTEIHSRHVFSTTTNGPQQQSHGPRTFLPTRTAIASESDHDSETSDESQCHSERDESSDNRDESQSVMVRDGLESTSDGKFSCLIKKWVVYQDVIRSVNLIQIFLFHRIGISDC